MNKHKKQNAFTLVELIVVITILAILGTIAFISLQWYSTQARDSTRVSDLASMKSSLELYQVEAGKYPNPTSGINVTYSWATVWNQGSFWETVYANVEKLDKIPTDPLTGNEYTYSVTSIKTEYQLWWILEWDEVVIRNNWITQTNAWVTIANAIVTWNYNGQITKSNSGTLCNILATPSIITNDTSVSDLQQIVTNSNFVYRWYKNLPGSFAGTKFKQNWWFAYQPATLLAYTDNSSCGDITAKTSSGTTARVQLLKWIQNAYTWTIVKDVWEIKRVLDLTINTSSPSQDVISYAWNFVNNSLWWNIVAGSSSNNELVNNSCNSTQPTNATLTTWTPTSVNQAWQSANSSNACYFNCSSGYGSTWTACVTATNCWVTGLTELTFSNWQTWSCINLWATTVWDWSTNPTNCGWTSTTNCNSGLTWIWNYYQWWRNEPVNTTTTGATYNWAFTWLLWHNNFVLWDSTYWDWWQDEAWNSTPTRWNWVNPQWPCSIWWHVPSQTEWKSVCDTISWTSCISNSTTVNIMKNTLRLPFAGYRFRSTGNYQDQTIGWYYWSSIPFISDSWFFRIRATTVSPFIPFMRGTGLSVRCIKN
jgi:type II secretion system protein G